MIDDDELEKDIRDIKFKKRKAQILKEIAEYNKRKAQILKELGKNITYESSIVIKLAGKKQL